MKTNFWGASLQVIPLGKAHVKLTKRNEIYEIQRASTLVHNLIFGTLYLEHAGPLTLVRKPVKVNPNQINSEPELEFIIDFKKAGWTKSKRNIIEGCIPVRQGSKKNWVVSGKWNEGVKAFNEET